MSFAAVQTADTKSGTVTSNTTNWTLTYPTNIAAGDLLLAFVALDGGAGCAFPAGWTLKRQAVGSANAICLGAKIATGSETGTFALTNNSEQGGWRVFRISAASWFGGSIGTETTDDADGFKTTATATGSPSANPNPASLDPSSWGTEDTLWIAAISVDTSRTISVYPLTDLQTADVSGGSGGATLGICMENDTVSSLDPGTFTVSASDDWVAMTVAVRPTAVIPVYDGNFLPLL